MGFLNQQHGGNTVIGESKYSSTAHYRSGLACMVNSEIGAVLAVMRRNVRWGIRYTTDDDQFEHSLIQSFKELRKQIFSWQNQWHTISPVLYLQPFLDVIKSDETGAPITGVALSSVYKFLSLEILDIDTVNVDDALHQVVDAVTSCRFEVTDPGSEEVVLMKILQVLLACMKNKASVKLSNQHVCNIVNTCFRVVHQASSKGELLQRIARHTMHELVRCIFSHLRDIANVKHAPSQGGRSYTKKEVSALDEDCSLESKQLDNGSMGLENNSQPPPVEVTSNDCSGVLVGKMDECKTEVGQEEDAENGGHVMMEPYGIPCMVEILHFLCSLLNVMDHVEIGLGPNPIAYDEDVPLFALGLINSAIELGGASIGDHPKLLSLIQDELFHNLMQFGLSMSPLILSTVCSIVHNLYHHLRTKLKLQLEAFFSCVLLRIAKGKHGASYQQQEVAMETLVDLCRQQEFVSEMYANFDCDISCSNVFEDLANLLSKSAFPVNGPLSAMHTLALDGLIAMIQGMASRVGNVSLPPEQASLDLEEYKPFWMVKCESYNNSGHWVAFLRKMKYIKRRLMVGADHFNRDPKKGLEFLQGIHLLPDKLDPKSVACFFRYTTGLDKNLVGDYLGNHDEFCIQVLHEFARTFDFQDMTLDTALRVFLETFRLPGESQKIQRVLEAFAERYYEQSPHILANKDAALLLSYSLILLNTDQHNAQVKKKMTEDDFIRNNRRINGGSDLPREYLSELYRSICENEIRMTPEEGAGFPVTIPSNWISLMHKMKQAAPFVICASGAHLDYDMFAILSGPTIAAISVVFDNVEQEDILQSCIEGFLAIAKIAACYHLDDVLNDLVVSLCKFTTLLHPLPAEETLLAFGNDNKARMATGAVFAIANRYGDFIRSGWKNILDCILSLHKLGFLPTRLVSDAADELEPSSELERGRLATSSGPAARILSTAHSRKSSGLMGRFSQLLYLDSEEPASQPSEEELAAHQRILQMIQDCHIDSIFAESKFLQAESLLQLSQALILAAGRRRKGNNFLEDENIAVFSLELLIAVALNNRDRIMLLWQGIYEHIASVVQSIVMPCALVEKAVFGLLRICQRLLPYKEDLTDELLKSLQLILKLDARVADAYCEHITQEVMRLVKANAMQIRSHIGWRTITSLLSITARHPEASETGFETLSFIMSGGAHLLPANYVLCVNAARQFAESRVGHVERSIRSLDLMAGSIVCLSKWSCKTKEASGEEAMKMYQDIGEMWLRLVQGLKKVCLDQREEVRNHAILSLQQSFTAIDGIYLPIELWFQCFDLVIFALLDDLLEIAQENSPKDYRNMEGSLALSIKLLLKVFLQFMHDLYQSASFCKLWLGVLNRMEKYMKVKFRGKRGEKIHELVPELLKNALLVMKARGILVPSDVSEDSFWQLTWLHVKKISASLQVEVFPGNELEQLQVKQIQTGGTPVSDENIVVPSGQTTV
ncbi:LOW QUALITY PROTEIN: ARF guanine-nucleotide exchange factor GNOM-like [Diospyros lotus]|uniref:LOW QUALITY PROTEIN: ARF guanine-nucleotide exchange factor GNOM-like n=1 Tax=Diospyros lotus TaxID=55363 RepID=UPI0022583F96|nr:LOW QUALITY PROTEIN: ARF guanine-nucleotide exchange factor GNOM-like [Diospyros lotus]